MIFREFDRDDICGICELINCELGYSVSVDDLALRIKQMRDDKHYCIFVAENNNEVIAFIGIHIGLAFEYSGKIARIIALAVKKEYHRQGIGTKLLQTAESYFKENHVELIAVNSGIRRVEAHRFYEKQGFYKKGYRFAKAVLKKWGIKMIYYTYNVLDELKTLYVIKQ